MTARSGVRAEPGAGGCVGTGLLASARAAAADCRWHDAYEALSELDRRSVLAADDLELLATSAFLRGRRQECEHARLRAYQIHVADGDVRRAVRCAARTELERLSTGDVAQAAGCLPVSLSSCTPLVAQASALLDQAEEGPEHGYPLVPVAYEQLAMGDDPEGAADTAQQAVDLGRRFGDPDLLTLALTIEGRAQVRSHRVHEGLASLDASVATVLAGVVSPLVAGLALTSALDASVEAFDPRRGDAWTHALTAWCAGQQGMLAFWSRALAHQAALHRRRGRWDEALAVAERACEPTIAELDPEAGAAARYQQGEVRRLRGELRCAGASYRQAGHAGLDPQPGLALLRLAEGDTAAASAAIGRALSEAERPLDRAALLPARVDVLLAAGDQSAAADAAGELETIAGHHGIPALDASAHEARAAVLLAGGDALAALRSARRACRVWRRLTLPYEEARALLLIARACRVLGDGVTAGLELDAGCRILETLGARPDLDAVRAMRDGAANAGAHGLTRRELEVLGLVANGLTNRAIAEDLMVTRRTVDTHVSRILTKLGVASRSAATAFAHRNHLV